MIIRMPSHMTSRIRAYLDDLNFNRPVHTSLKQLEEVVTIFNDFDGLEDKEIVRHFHKDQRKIDGIKTLRLMTDYTLSDAKSMYERLCEEIDREIPKVDVNLLKQMLTYHVSQKPGMSITADFRLFIQTIDRSEVPGNQKFFADNELRARGYEPMTIWLYAAARDHYSARTHASLGDILGEALKQ